uniref:IRG-type G domain-containing protein n=1 Tax=Panagrolaimus davidi TaxID=227884 RepID=A0A914QWX0_9BILA
MRNIIGEICQTFEPDVFIDTVNDYACFYKFPEEANTTVKGVIEKYRMKRESEEARKRQQKEMQILQRKIKQEKAAQIRAEEEIKLATAKIEKQNYEMNELIRRQKMTIKEKIAEAKMLHKIESESCYNFAFAGHTKTGKSSLINSIRGIDDKESTAAKVGIVETTQIIQKYPYYVDKLKNIEVNFYDIPGSGTLSHHTSQYYQEKGLCAFDCLFILIQETFCEEEIKFAIEALKHNQKVAFIQSKCDILLTNRKKQKIITTIDQTAVDEFLEKLKENRISEIRKSNISQLHRIPCFYVSSFNLYNLKNGFELDPDVRYNENELLEFMASEIKFSRNTIL